jgi:hypothetical protein
MFKTLAYLTAITVSPVLFGATLAAAPGTIPFDHPLVFEPNRGQVGPEVTWMARARGYQVFITSDSATFVVLERESKERQQNLPPVFSALEVPTLSDAHRTVLRMKLAGSGAWNAIGGEPTGGVSNYFVGSDPRRWRSNIPHYGRLKIAGVYEGIDLVFYDHDGNLEYDFIVAPEADPGQIRLTFDGAESTRLDESAGDLVLTTATGGEFRTHRPRVFQETPGGQVEVAGAYDILDRQGAAFTLATYDATRPLVIDPTVTFTTFFQGGAEDIATGIAADSAGNSYVSGWTFSSDFSATNVFGNPASKACAPSPRPKTFCATFAFVTKLSPTGGILFFTYLGGSDLDLAHAVAADATGVYVAGITFSNDFPTYFGTYKRGGGDVFVTKLSPTGALIYSSVFGGASVDSASAIAVDAAQWVYIAGKTKSADYPISFVHFPAPTPPMQKSFAGVEDAFVTKLDPRGFLYGGYSTYLGGSNIDEAHGLAIDDSGFAYVTGITFSRNFPTVGPSYGFPVGEGSTTAFVTKLVPGGTGVLYSLCLGGGSDEGTAIAVGPTGNAFVTGDTASAAFPTTPGVFQPNKPSPQIINGLYNFDGFIAEISPGGLLRSATYLGGSNGATFPRSIALNSIGYVYVAGDTFTTDFPGPSPITPNPTAGFLVKFTSPLNALAFRIYLGAQINSIFIPRAPGKFPPIALTPTYIYTAGYRFRPGSDVRDAMNTDGFAVKVEDGAVIAQAPVFAQ